MPVGPIFTIVQRCRLLREIPLFSSVGWYNLQRIARRAQVLKFQKGEVIRKEGDPSDGLYCLVSGRVQAYSSAGSQRKADVEFYRRGMAFGIISLLTGEPHSSTYEAINDSVVIKIEKDEFDYILRFMPQLGVELSHSLSSKLRSKMIPGKKNVEHRIISVYSPLRGSGSSTYSANLAFELEQQTHRKVILVSITPVEPNGQGTKVLEETSPNWQKAPVHLKDIADDYEKLQASIIRGQLKIDLLHVAFDAGDKVLIDQISHFVTTLVSDYHFAVVDLPTEKDDIVFKTLSQSDMVHLVARDGQEDLKIMGQLITELTERMKEHFSPDFIKVIITSKERSEATTLQEISETIDFPVLAHFPYIKREDLKTNIACEAMSINLPWPNCPYALMVRRTARQLSGVTVGLALGGGAALGVAHIGVLRVLEQENIPVDMIVGSSMGALIAAFWVTGKNADGLEVIARDFEKPKDMGILYYPAFSFSGFIGERNIVKWLNSRGLEGKTFYDTRIPLKVVAYDLIRREELVISSGNVTEAVRQSISIPGVIEPIKIKDRVIIDGGVLNPLPTNVLGQNGVKKIIAVNVLQSPEQALAGFLEEQRQLAQEAKVTFRSAPRKYLGMQFKKLMIRLFTPNIPDIIVRTLQASEYILATQSAQAADVVIHPDLTNINWFELYEVDKLIARGEEAARAALPQIRKMLEET